MTGTWWGVCVGVCPRGLFSLFIYFKALVRGKEMKMGWEGERYPPFLVHSTCGQSSQPWTTLRQEWELPTSLLNG